MSAGLAPWGLGSDTGGSIKQPAALCGNVGLRPTYGTVSRFGVVAFASSLDQIGPVAKNVRDCARLYSIIAGRDPADSTTVDVPEVELPQGESLKGLRIGVPKQYFEAGLDAEIGAATGIEILPDGSFMAVAEPTLAAAVIYYGPTVPPPGPRTEELDDIRAPIIAFSPLLNAWFGLANPLSKMMMAAVLVFFPVVVNVTRGLTQVEPAALELMRSYAASEET